MPRLEAPPASPSITPLNLSYSMKVTIAIALQKCEADVYLRFSDRVRVLRDQAAGVAA